MENFEWRKCVSSITSAILLYTLTGIGADVLELAGYIKGAAEVLSSWDFSFAPDEMDVAQYLCMALCVLGYFSFFSGLSKFSKLQRTTSDRDSVMKARSGYIFLLVAVVLDFIPVIGGLLGFIFVIIGYVKVLSGFRALRDSRSFPRGARGGASTIRSATIWLLIAGLIGCIPIVGNAIESLITLITFFVVLNGWGTIQNAALDDFAAESESEDSAGNAFAGASGAKPVKDQVRNYTDERLQEIVASPEMYRADLVEKCRREIEIRAKSEAFRDKVHAYDDAKLREVLAAPQLYAEEIYYACQREMEERRRIVEERQAREAEQARIERAREAEAERIRRAEQWKKQRPYVYTAVATVLLFLLGLSFYMQWQEKQRLEQIRIEAEQARIAEEQRLAEEERIAMEKLAEEERKQAEAKRRAAERAAAAEAAAKKAAEEKRIADEAAAKRAEEERRIAAAKKAEQDRLDNDESYRHSLGIYRVGDYYNREGVEGVVISISNNGKNGLLLNLSESYVRCDCIVIPSGWRLPSLSEMNALFTLMSKSFRIGSPGDRISEALRKHGGRSISTVGKYWISTTRTYAHWYNGRTKFYKVSQREMGTCCDCRGVRDF